MNKKKQDKAPHAGSGKSGTGNYREELERLQVELAHLQAWESAEYCTQRLGLDAPLGSIDRSRLNVNGSSLAAGHPFAATGGRIIATLAKMLNEKGSGRGLISICAAGGQGVVAIIEKPAA